MCGQTGAQHVSPSHLPQLCHICSSNTGFTPLQPQTMDDDGQLSSSEGSTVDGMPGGDGDSLDFELEECMEPDACFPDGEYDHSHCHHLTYYSLGVILHVTIVNHHLPFVSAQAVCKSSSVVR